MRANAKFPIYETIDGKKKIIWRNVFRINVAYLILLIFVIGLSLLYIRDTGKCRDLIAHPCDYVEKFNCFNESYEKIIEPGPFEDFNFSSESMSKKQGDD